MRRLTSIVAVNAQGVIGLGNALPWRVKSDLRFFKDQTSQNIIIMGRKTHDSLGKCLPNRFNVVVSHQLALFENNENCILQYGIFDALLAAENAPTAYKEIFVVGGASMYSQFAPLVDRYLITIVDKVVPDGDAFFDQRIIGDIENWEMQSVKSGVANADGDESNFSIFELVARNPEGRRREREAGLAEVAKRIHSNSKRAKPATKAIGRSEGLSFAFL